MLCKIWKIDISRVGDSCKRNCSCRKNCLASEFYYKLFLFFPVLEQNITNTIITQEDNNDHENDVEVRSTVSSASSSPFELCEVTDIAIIESADLPSCKLSERKNINKRPDDDCQKAFTISNNDKHNSDAVDTKTGMHISLLKPNRETSNPGNFKMII